MSQLEIIPLQLQCARLGDVKPVITISSLDTDFSLSTRHILEADGFCAHLAMGPVETIAAVRSNSSIGLLVDGRTDFAVEICRAVRDDATTSKIRIIALLPVDATDRFSAFLSAGVDEAFVRPVEPRRYLLALKRDLIEEREPVASGPMMNRLSYSGLVIDLRSHRIVHGSHEVHLSTIEFGLLRQLMSDPTRVFRRDELILGAWPRGVFVDPRTVNVHIGRLRRALNHAMHMDIIRTVRGVGYALDANLP